RLLAADAARAGGARRAGAGGLTRVALHRRGLQDPPEDVAGPDEVVCIDLRAELVGPRPLGLLDLPQRRRAGGGERGELRAPVAWVIVVADQPVALELVGDALDALASQAPGPGDLRDAHRRR